MAHKLTTGRAGGVSSMRDASTVMAGVRTVATREGEKMITSTTESTRTGRALAVVAVVALAMTALPATSDATAKLWLYPDTDDPRMGGHVVEEATFTLIVENVGAGGGKDADNTAYETELIVSVNDLSLLVSIMLDGDPVVIDSYGVPEMPCTFRSIPPHGRYPSDFGTEALGDIAEGDEVALEVEIEGSPGLEVHFDAVAYGQKERKESVECYDVVNPSGHHVTAIVPEEAEPDCPDVSIEKSTTTTGVEVGDEVEYLIVVETSAECGDLTEVQVTENIPMVEPEDDGDPVPAFEIIAAEPPPIGLLTDDPLVWDFGTVPAGEPREIMLTVLFNEPLAAGERVENTACVSAAELDEPICSSARVAVGETPADETVGGAGFWCNRMRLALAGIPGASYSVEELEALLADVDVLSDVFFDVVDVNTAEAAQGVLCSPRGAPPGEKLQRQLLALWLNVVSERIGVDVPLADLCPGDEHMPDDVDEGIVTVGDALAAAEAALLADDPPAERAELLHLMELLDFINNASVAGEDGCPSDESESLRARRGFGHRRVH
jgi:hypothetical protein